MEAPPPCRGIRPREAMRDADYVKAFKLMWGMLIIAIAVSEGLL